MMKEWDKHKRFSVGLVMCLSQVVMWSSYCVDVEFLERRGVLTVAIAMALTAPIALLTLILFSLCNQDMAEIMKEALQLIATTQPFSQWVSFFFPFDK